MNTKGRIRLFFGIVLVLVASASLILWMDERRSIIKSKNAEINAKSYTVGLDYSGLITKQFIKSGDKVEAGQTLFQVRSTSLTERIAELNLTQKDLLYPLNSEGEILIKASRSGLVSDVKFSEGSFVPANEELATIIDQSTLKVLADYDLARRDFTSLKSTTPIKVRLPEGNWVNGDVESIKVVEQQDSKVNVEITAQLDEAGTGDFRSNTGVPVETTIRLRDATLYSKLRSQLNEWISTAKIGASSVRE